MSLQVAFCVRFVPVLAPCSLGRSDRKTASNAAVKLASRPGHAGRTSRSSPHPPGPSGDSRPAALPTDWTGFSMTPRTPDPAGAVLHHGQDAEDLYGGYVAGTDAQARRLPAMDARDGRSVRRMLACPAIWGKGSHSRADAQGAADSPARVRSRPQGGGVRPGRPRPTSLASDCRGDAGEGRSRA